MRRPAARATFLFSFSLYLCLFLSLSVFFFLSLSFSFSLCLFFLSFFFVCVGMCLSMSKTTTRALSFTCYSTLGIYYATKGYLDSYCPMQPHRVCNRMIKRYNSTNRILVVPSTRQRYGFQDNCYHHLHRQRVIQGIIVVACDKTNKKGISSSLQKILVGVAIVVLFYLGE